MVWLLGAIVGLVVLGWCAALGPLANYVAYRNYQTSPEHVQAIAQQLTEECTQLAETPASDATGRLAYERQVVYLVGTVDYGTMDLSPPTRACVVQSFRDLNRPLPR